MAYVFQTFVTSNILTSTQMNQVETNIKDHVHGASGVTGNFASFTGSTFQSYYSLTNKRAVIGKDHRTLSIYDESVGYAICNVIDSIVNSKTHLGQIVSNINSGGSNLTLFTTLSLQMGISYMLAPGSPIPSGINGAIYGTCFFVNSVSDWYSDFYSLRTATVLYTDLDSLLFYVGPNRNWIDLKSKSIRLGITNADVNSTYNWSLTNSLSDNVTLSNKIYEINYDPVQQSKRSINRLRSNPIYPANLTDTLIIKTSSMGSYNFYKAAEIGETFEIIWSYCGRQTSGGSDNFLTLTCTGTNITPLAFSAITDLVGSADTATRITSGICILAKTTLLSGQHYSSRGSVLIRVNSAVGPQATFTLVSTSFSGTFETNASSGDDVGLYVNY